MIMPAVSWIIRQDICAGERTREETAEKRATLNEPPLERVTILYPAGLSDCNMHWHQAHDQRFDTQEGGKNETV